MAELSCRLIKASNLAYAIEYSKPSNQQSPEVFGFLRDIGLIPDTLTYTQVGTDACVFAETPSEAVLAFRGTLPPTIILQDQRQFLVVIKDWLDDIKIRLVKGQNLPGRVHHGFLNSLDALWPKIQTFVGATQKPLYVTGHSKGGGLAFLASYRLSKTGRTPQAVYTFAAPKVGDAAFAEAYDAEVPETYRVEYRDDIVPHLPASTGAWVKIFEGHQAVNDAFPAEAPHLHVHSDIAKEFEDLIARVKAQLAIGLNYAPAGRLEFYDWQTPPQLHSESRLLKLDRALKLGAKVAELRFDEIIEDHFSNGGYLATSCGAASIA